jgi:hypothetical protein
MGSALQSLLREVRWENRCLKNDLMAIPSDQRHLGEEHQILSSQQPSREICTTKVCTQLITTRLILCRHLVCHHFQHQVGSLCVDQAKMLFECWRHVGCLRHRCATWHTETRGDSQARGGSLWHTETRGGLLWWPVAQRYP